MPKLSHITSVLIIGSGPIVIGQGCEFDYAGVQAIKAFKEEGVRVILINPNPATIMTDQEMSDATYIEPINLLVLEEIIAKERPSAIVPNLGGQTALNWSLALADAGILDKYEVEFLGVSAASIKKAEDRQLFRQVMQENGIPLPRSYVANTKEEIKNAIEELGLPLLGRTSYTLGGHGAKIISSVEEAMTWYTQIGQGTVTLDECLLGWKEIEMEMMADHFGNVIVVCGVENMHPLGVHTGDSIAVAPIQTLTDKEYQTLRNYAITIMYALQIQGSGSNIQFAINPHNGRVVVIEMNPRVSRSSALVSKATGFPIAKIAAKLALGYYLNELANDITSSNDYRVPAAFEPAIDYVVVKIPRFSSEKFSLHDADACLQLGPEMKAIGEVMAIGSSFVEAMARAIESLEQEAPNLSDITDSNLVLQRIAKNDIGQIYWVLHALSLNIDIKKIQAACHFDLWFLQEMQILALPITCWQELNAQKLYQLKQQGFSDAKLAKIWQVTSEEVRAKRKAWKIKPVYKCVDSCAGELPTNVSYLYPTYQQMPEATINHRKERVLIIGSGPNRIGQGIEFDYICVKAVQSLQRAGYEVLMVNSNPATVSTDYHIVDQLYFSAITSETILDLLEFADPKWVFVQFAGQTPLNMLQDLPPLLQLPLCGLSKEVIDKAEDRGYFANFLHDIGVQQPKNYVLTDIDEIINCPLSYPIILRPSFVLGGKGMQIVHSQTDLETVASNLLAQNKGALLLEEYLSGALEIEVDVISDGDNIFIPLILEQVEYLGIHSGDSAVITPPVFLPQEATSLIHAAAKQIAIHLPIVGVFNIQFAWWQNTLYLIEVNPRASRSLPFTAKATGIDLIAMAVECLLGKKLPAELPFVNLPYYCAKESVLPFNKFPNTKRILGPEMLSTGEVMAFAATPWLAFYKAQLALYHIPANKVILFSGLYRENNLFLTLQKFGWEMYSNVEMLPAGVQPSLVITLDTVWRKWAIEHGVLYITTLEGLYWLVEALAEKVTEPVFSLQERYNQQVT